MNRTELKKLAFNHPNDFEFGGILRQILTSNEEDEDETETENFTQDRIFPAPVITEKSYKPFISCQVPVWLAAQGHMAYLRGLGFEVMEDLLPLGYDNMNTFDKIQAITDLVARGREFIENFYFSHLKEIQHNHELVSSDRVEHLMLQRITNFLT